MMAGKHISDTHVAGSSTKVMLNGGQHGVAVGCAALLCKKYGTTPRGVGKEHIKELQDIVNERGDYKGALGRRYYARRQRRLHGRRGATRECRGTFVKSFPL